MHTSVDSAVDNAVRSATGFSNGLPEALSLGLSPDFGAANWLPRPGAPKPGTTVTT